MSQESHKMMSVSNEAFPILLAENYWDAWHFKERDEGVEPLPKYTSSHSEYFIPQLAHSSYPEAK